MQEERHGGAYIAHLPRRDLQTERPAASVYDGVDFRRPAAAGATDRLRLRPPFPPAAERWTFAVVLSIICLPHGLAATRAENNFCHRPRPAQR